MNRYDFIQNCLKIKAEVVMIDMISEKLLALAVHVLLRDALHTSKRLALGVGIQSGKAWKNHPENQR